MMCWIKAVVDRIAVKWLRHLILCELCVTRLNKCKSYI